MSDLTAKSLNNELANLQDEIAEHHEPTDKELLEWAKKNYPYHEHEVARKKLQAKIDETNAKIASIK